MSQLKGREASASPEPSTTPVVHSSAAFLHHLHTDPSSHHITLSSSTSRSSSTAPSKSPRSISTPLEPTVEGLNQPVNLPSSHSQHLNSTAGPSSLRGLSRNSSRRGRPSTAPNSAEGPLSPDVFERAGLDDYAGSREEDLPRLASDVEYCLPADMMSPGGISDMMEFAHYTHPIRSHNGSSLIGRAGVMSSRPAPEPIAPPPMVAPPVQTADPLSWKTFAKSYAHGLFDPNRIPNPPRPEESTEEPGSVHSSPGKRYVPLSVVQRRADTVTSGSSQSTASSVGSAGSANTISTSASSIPSSSLARSAGSSIPSIKSATTGLPSKMRDLRLDEQATRRTLLRPDKLSLPSYSLAAATVRMASSLRESDFAPLGMPSPERELVDPLSAVISAEGTAAPKSASSDPGGSRLPLSRSMSSAVGATQPSASFLAPIIGSPVGTPSEHPDRVQNSQTKMPEMPRTRTSPTRLKGGVVGTTRIPPATAPVEKTIEADAAEDYFGNASPYSSNASSQTAKYGETPGTRLEEKPSSSLSETPAFALPPLAHAQDIGDLYTKLGWLPAPLPPNELARRKALYRYGILHTAPDVNFDRLAHMTKLVFSTKIVLIALIEGDKQWHKSEAGLGANEASRISSFCSHSILSPDDEPLVVLDASQDWRFAENPQVVGPPNIRFYAGAPLRTSDGHNIGSLCIIDDKPRSEFPPRSRLILKELAAVTVREMELWKDKLQLRIRDKIQNSMEKFTRECLELDATSASNAQVAAKMDQVYSRAAQLVCSTLDLDGCFILDISQFEMLEMPGRETIFRADAYVSETSSPVLERSDSFGVVNPFPVLATTPAAVPTRPLTPSEHEKLSTFLRENKDGKIFENVAPSWIRYMFPQSLRYGMAVPVYGVDQQPFAMICAYTTNKSKQYLEGYELQFLRAIGVIILSAVLRRRMVLADKTKSVLISSVSHELRTPLHGILAAAELLSDTKLDANQISFLKTVQTCGNSLIETVNHVLDFTKLSGSSSSSTGSSIKLARVNLASLVESTVEGCWIGQRARFFNGDSEIGSFYAPPAPSGLLPRAQRDSVAAQAAYVETVIDIGQREKGWNVRCERGGLRRVLMNLVGNSLKFTKDGYVRVTLRELSHPPGAKKIPVEMAVIDTGKGIGKEFLKEQLFHPFSQENPLQTGTGLGLAIVNSIVRSENVNGKVDVWSSEGVGTEIRVSFDVEVIDDEDDSSSASSSSAVSVSSSVGRGYSISLLAFNHGLRGHVLSLDVLSSYAAAWQFELESAGLGDILIINDDEQKLGEIAMLGKPIIFMTTGRPSDAAEIRDQIRNSGGWIQFMHKPIGPSALRATLISAVQFLDPEHDEATTPGLQEERPPISRGSSGASAESNSTVSELSRDRFDKHSRESRAPLMRRRSEEHEAATSSARPSLAPRGMTYHHAPKRPMAAHEGSVHNVPVPGSGSVGGHSSTSSTGSPQPGSPTSAVSTISLADGGVMLKAAAVITEAAKTRTAARVLVVEDNIINRRVLAAFLQKWGMEFHEAVDGQAGVDVFRHFPPKYFDVILMDITMPVMNGHEATREIRKIEAERNKALSSESQIVSPPGGPFKVPPKSVVQGRAKVFALTGLATSDDKREAFSSGVDGYLVKPVSLKSLGLIFQKIGFSKKPTEPAT